MSGFRITRVWMFVTVDPACGDEGLPTIPRVGSAGLIVMPMVSADERNRDGLLRAAQEVANRDGHTIEVRRFDGPYVVERTIRPAAAGYG